MKIEFGTLSASALAAYGVGLVALLLGILGSAVALVVTVVARRAAKSESPEVRGESSLKRFEP